MDNISNPGPMGKLLRLGAAIKKDGWSNILTGLGVKGKDKRLGAEVLYIGLKESEVENLYACDDIAGKTVDLIPGEGTREWIEYTLPEDEGGKDIINDIENFNNIFEVQERFSKAWNWARLYGGAGIFVAVDDGQKDLTKPLNIESIRSIKALTVLSRYELNNQEITSDITSPNFGLPEIYMITPRIAAPEGSISVHYTRIIRFDGSPLPRRKFTQNNYWGDSVLTRLFNVLRNFNLSHDSAASIMQEFKVGILKLKGLADLIVQDDEDVIKQRIELMNLSKSVLNTIVLDAEDESYENLTTTLSGVDTMLKAIDNRMVSATGMPHTLILGDGASGIFSGGRQEEQQHADFIKRHQLDSLKRPTNQWNRILMASRKGPTKGKILPGLGWTFRPIFQLDDNEKAELRGKNAVTDQIYIQNGVLDQSEIRESRFAGDEYGMEISIDSELDEELANKELEPQTFDNMDKIEKRGEEYVIMNKLGTEILEKGFKTKEAAVKRIGEIEAFKAKEK